MTSEPAAANTPETLGVTPRYVLLHNAISRSAHNLSATAKKVTAMAMALLPADLSSLSTSFTFAELARRLGMSTTNLYNRMKRDNFTNKDLQKIAEVLDCTFKAGFVLNNTGEEI